MRPDVLLCSRHESVRTHVDVTPMENQATDRAYRIGQEKSVFAYKFITTGTVEEAIDQMLEDKQKVTDMIVGNDESWLSKLDAKTFIDLIKLKQERVSES